MTHSPLVVANRLLAKLGYQEMCWTLLSQCHQPSNASPVYSMLKFAVPVSTCTDKDLLHVTGREKECPHPAWALNHTVHQARGPVDAKVVLHCHDDVSALFSAGKRPIRPLIQDSVYFYGDRLVTHAPQDSHQVLSRKLQEQPHAIAANLLNHGSLVWGRTLPEAIMRFYYMRRAMDVQLKAEALAGVPMHEPPAELVAELQRQWEDEADPVFGGMANEYDYLLAEHGLRQPSHN